MPGLKKDSTEYRLIEVTKKVLVEEYNSQLKTKRFHWKDDNVFNRIKSAYRKQHGPISSGDMKIIDGRLNNEKWRGDRAGSARAKSNIGIVEERIGGARLGDVNLIGRRTAAFRATQNTEEGRGVQMSIDLPQEKLGLIIDCLLSIQAHETPKELPPDLKMLFLKDSDEGVRRAVISKQFDMVQKWLKDATGNNMDMPAKQVLQSMRITFKQIERLVKNRKYSRRCKDPELARQQEIDLRMFTILSARELMHGEEALLGQGYVVLLPVIVTLSTGEKLRFQAVATMVSGKSSFLRDFDISSSLTWFIVS